MLLDYTTNVVSSYNDRGPFSPAGTDLLVFADKVIAFRKGKDVPIVEEK